MNRILIILLIIFSCLAANSQSSIEAKFMFFSMHPFKTLRQPDTDIYENRIDDNANFIKSPGILLSYQKYLYLTRLSFQISQGFFSDAIANVGSVTSLLLKYKFYHKYKISVSLGLGPSLSIRQDWHNNYRYIENDGYTINGNYQTRWYLGGELSFYYYISKRSDLSLSFLVGHEYGSIAINLGYKFWINTSVKFKSGCRDCKNKFNRGPNMKHWWVRIWY